MVKALYTPDDYDDLTDLVEAEGDKYKVEYKEAKKKKAATAKSVFPKVLKVHCHKKEDCDRFAKMIEKRLSPETLEFEFKQSSKKNKNAAWIDERSNEVRFSKKERLAEKNQHRRETDL